MMNQIIEYSRNLIENPVLRVTGAVVITSIILFKAFRKYKRNKRRQAYPKDVVILHQFPRGLRAPSASPFALKLETWLRMANIKYQNEFGYEFGPKGKVPFITLNGEDVADSQFVIEYLSKKFNVNFSSNYSPEQNGIARAFFKLTEESFFWTMVLTRFVYEPNSKAVGIPSFLIKIMGSRIKGRSKAQGYGLHSERELQSIRNADLDAINSFIGNKKYLLGDKVCDADAALFGMLAQTYFHDRGSSYDYLTSKCPNIVRYLNTIKTEYWADWNQHIRDKSSN